MRKIAIVKKKINTTERLMLYQKNGEIYLFGYDKSEDGSCSWDQFYEEISELYDDCADRFGVKIGDWTIISDPLEGCQHDWIEPTKMTIENNQVLFNRI